MVLAHRERTARGRNTADQVAGAVAREGEHRLDLGVLRKRPGVGQIDGATGRVELERPLPPLLDLVNDPARVAHEELGGVHQHAVAGAGHDVEAPVHRRREGVAHGPRLGGVVGDGPELVVGLDQQHPRPDAARLEDVRSAQLPPVDPHRIAPEAGSHRDLVEELGVQLGDLPEEGAGVVIPVEVEEALHGGGALGVGFDGGEVLGRGRGVGTAEAANTVAAATAKVTSKAEGVGWGCGVVISGTSVGGGWEAFWALSERLGQGQPKQFSNRRRSPAPDTGRVEEGDGGAQLL